MKKMRAGVIAHGGAAYFVVDDGIEFVADVNWLLRSHAVRANALHRIRNSLDISNERVVVCGVKRADVADLSAGVGVEGRVIEYNFATLARLQLLHANTSAVFGLDDGEHFTSVGARLAIAFENSRLQALIGRTCRCLRAALPGSLSAFALFFHRSIKAGLIELNALIARSIDHEVQWQSERIVESEGFCSI